MSQDPPTPPESEQPTPETPTPTPPPPPSRPPGGWRGVAIATLRSAIDLLEAAIVKLEAEPTPTVAGLPAQTPISRILAPIRAVLPASLNRGLSDWGLTGAIALILVVVTWTTTTLLSPKPSEVARVPPTTPPEVTEIPPATLPDATQIPPVTPPEVTEIPPLEPEFPPEETAPPEFSQPEEFPPVTTEPPPVETIPPPLTPEQSLIAAIQDRLAQVTTQYADVPIASIQANFDASRLLVKISNEWYNLSASRQDKLAAQMLERARELDFTIVQIIDTQGSLVARSPVVGSQMIIVKRQNS